MTHKLDLLITNGRILDGTGNPEYEADIGIISGSIAVMGHDINKTHADRIIDAEGMVVSPGFIDTHSHDDAYLLINPHCDDKVRQGVTTNVIGNCGFSLAPLSDEHRDDMRKASAIMGGSHLPDDFWKLSSFQEFLLMLEDTRPGDGSDTRNVQNRHRGRHCRAYIPPQDRRQKQLGQEHRYA